MLSLVFNALIYRAMGDLHHGWECDDCCMVFLVACLCRQNSTNVVPESVARQMSARAGENDSDDGVLVVVIDLDFSSCALCFVLLILHLAFLLLFLARMFQQVSRSGNLLSLLSNLLVNFKFCGSCLLPWLGALVSSLVTVHVPCGFSVSSLCISDMLQSFVGSLLAFHWLCSSLDCCLGV